MKLERLALSGVALIKPSIFRDDRGHFLETWRAQDYAQHDFGPFVQDNASVSKKGVLRGLHFQHPHGQAKLISVLRGSVFDVAVDARIGSPTFGRWIGAELSGENGHQLFVPKGFAHGFLALTDEVVLSYKCTDLYVPAAERSVNWSDPAIAIAWPAQVTSMSAKDSAAPSLRDIPPELLPTFEPPRA